MSENVVAVVAGHEITELELNAFIASLPREQQMYASNPQFKQQCIEQLTALHMFAELGAEQKSALKEHLRKENGKITFTDMCNEVVRIFNASKEIKNL